MANASTLSPEVIEAAKKLQAKREKDMEKRRQHIKKNYPYADPKTLTYDHEAGKYKVEVTCVKTKVKHWRYTQDLKQCKGLSPEAKKEADKAAKKEKKALLAKAMKAIEEGKI